MALKVASEIVKELECIMCEKKKIESLDLPEEEWMVCLDCIDDYVRESEEYYKKYPPRDEKE